MLAFDSLPPKVIVVLSQESIKSSNPKVELYSCMAVNW